MNHSKPLGSRGCLLAMTLANDNVKKQIKVEDSRVCGEKCSYLIQSFSNLIPIISLFVHPVRRYASRLLYYRKEYGSFVYILADLEQLAAAELFVGTFSSNVGRLVTVLREGLGKPRSSSISLDTSWFAGRQRGLLEG